MLATDLVLDDRDISVVHSRFGASRLLDGLSSFGDSTCGQQFREWTFDCCLGTECWAHFRDPTAFVGSFLFAESECLSSLQSKLVGLFVDEFRLRLL